jgi:acetyl esterase/lipase
MASDLASAGVATWSVEYRRVGDDGGGWPGTFEDVAAAADFLRTVADPYHLDLERVVALGHSAGGHLAMWLAGRQSLPTDDHLRGADPLPLRGVVALAGIFDLAAYAAPEGCGSAVAPLLGGDPDEVVDRLRRASPIQLAPVGVPQVLVLGTLDPIVPREQARSYERIAEAAGDRVEVQEIEGAGHFELVVPGTAAFQSVREAVLGLVRPQR